MLGSRLGRLSLRRYPFPGSDQRSEEEIGQRKDDVEVFEMALVMLVVMSVEPGEPRALLEPARLGHVHAEVKILVEEIVGAERRHAAEKNIRSEQVLNPEYHGGMEADNQRRVPPGETNVLMSLALGQEIGRSGAKNPMVDQGMGAKGVRP